MRLGYALRVAEGAENTAVEKWRGRGDWGEGGRDEANSECGMRMCGGGGEVVSKRVNLNKVTSEDDEEYCLQEERGRTIGNILKVGQGRQRWKKKQGPSWRQGE